MALFVRISLLPNSWQCVCCALTCREKEQGGVFGRQKERIERKTSRLQGGHNYLTKGQEG